MMKHYIFFTRNVLPQPRPDLVQVVNCANAAANLGYSTVLTYLGPEENCNPLRWLNPFHPETPEATMVKFYNIQEKLKVSALPIPWSISQWQSRWTSPSTLISKYYLPVHIRRRTQLVHTRDWNFVKAAIRSGIPTIYEHHHHEDKPFEPEITRHPLFQIAITVADTVRESMIAHGMPADKVVKVHNGYNQLFAIRQPEQAELWRQKLLANQYQYLAVYSGGLYKFKGVDLLIDVAKEMPQIQFACAGGDETQVAEYRQLAAEKQVSNVTFLGYVLHEQLASLLQAADVLLHPHCTGPASTFTSPLKFFDYMATGTPIVATEIPSMMEFKTSGAVAGWCEPDRPQPLIDCIQRVLETHPRQLEGYAHSVEFVRQFSWENRINRILSYVQDAYKPVPVEA